MVQRHAYVLNEQSLFDEHHDLHFIV